MALITVLRAQNKRLCGQMVEPKVTHACTGNRDRMAKDVVSGDGDPILAESDQRMLEDLYIGAAVFAQFLRKMEVRIPKCSAYKLQRVAKFTCFLRTTSGTSAAFLPSLCPDSSLRQVGARCVARRSSRRGCTSAERTASPQC